MKPFPQVVRRYMQQVLEGEVAPYCAVLDQWGCLIADEGNPLPFGLTSIEPGQSHEWLGNLLEGVEPGEKVEWSFLELPNGSHCHLHVLPVDKGHAALFFDASEAHDQLVEIQQRANEMQLLNYQLAQLTEQLQTTEAALRESKHNLEQANRVKSRFIASMSHEFRTPLTSIMGHTTILNSLTADRDDLVPHFEALERGAKHLLSLIENVLDQSVGKIVIQPTPTPIQSICDDIDGIFKLPAQAKGLAFKLSLHAEDSIAIDIDEVRCRQVLVNLIGNAVKFTDQGFIQIDISWRDHWLTFDIQDSGPGVPKGIREHLFQPFLRGENNSKPGAGLGLALSQQLVSLMGGSIKLVDPSSTQAQGSHFRVSLPAPRVTPTQGDRQRIVAPSGAVNILLVEDDPDLSKLLRFLLEQHQWRVYAAGTSAAALATAQEKRLDLVVIDLNLPDQRGTETISQLRRQGLQIPILAMSASPDTQDADRAAAAGCDQYLLKPLKLPHFIATVQRLLPQQPA